MAKQHKDRMRSLRWAAYTCLKSSGATKETSKMTIPSSQFWENNAAPPIEDSKILKNMRPGVSMGQYDNDPIIWIHKM